MRHDNIIHCILCRCLILADVAKTAHGKYIWDIASVACQLCLCYDDGQWKGVFLYLSECTDVE